MPEIPYSPHTFIDPPEGGAGGLCPAIEGSGALSLDTGTNHAKHHLGHAGGHRHFLGAILLTLSFAVVEVVAGWWSGSLALISDAGHMVTDSSALGLAALAAWFAKRPPSLRHTYGLVRLEILVALLNSLLMLVLIGWIVLEAIDRFGAPNAVNGSAVMGVAAIGLAVNAGVAWRLHHGGDDLNTRAALLHVLGDLLGSVAALTSGAVIWFTGWLWVDPALSLGVAALILVSAVRLLNDAVHVLLEAVPAHIDIRELVQGLARIEGVNSVHDLHVWSLSSGQIALSAHLNLDCFADWPRILATAREQLAGFGIGHATLQPEEKSSCPSSASNSPVN
jgi:cobalt-zinc-cadmium efflux system protein